MVDRFLLWLGAGVVTAGISPAMLTGAGSGLPTPNLHLTRVA
jgi:hypothetical protein